MSSCILSGEASLGEDRNCCHAPWRCPVWTGSGDTRGHVTRDNTSQLPPGQWLVNQWCHCRECVLSNLGQTSWPPIHYEYWEWRHQYQEPFIYSGSSITYHMLRVCCVFIVYCVTCPRNRSGSLTIIQYQSPNNLINQLPIITSKWPKLGRLYKR